jgi:tetratricopeptide (TPR) repeat protein
MFDELKQKGIRYYNRRKFREALEYFNYAYGLLKWVEFKDKERQKNFIIKPSMNAILDSDIDVKKCNMDDPKSQEESFKSCVVYILLIMSYCFIELRHYSSAINCLNECEEEAGDLVPDVFLRRAQALMNKKTATKIELQKAEEDLEKSIILATKFNEELAKEYNEYHPVYRARYINMDIYYLIKKQFEKIKEDKINEEIFRVRRVIGTICDEEHKNMTHEEAMFIEGLVLSKKEDIFRYYKVFKEMKNQYKQIIKFFSETNNPDLMDLTYDEYEKFMDSFEQFKFYYNFEFDNIDPKAINHLNEEEKKMINDENKNDFYIKRLMHLCENIYSHGYYNIDVFQFSLETVLEEESKEKEKEEKKEKINQQGKEANNFLMKISKGKFGLYVTICFIMLTIIAIGSQLLM